MTDDKELTFLIVSLPDDEQQAKDTAQSTIYYTTLKHKLTKEESLLLTACTESGIFYEDEYNTRGGGTKSIFADYLLGRYSKKGEAEWREHCIKPALSGVDSFWHDEIVAGCKKLPKHDVMIAAPTIKEAYEYDSDYLDRLDNQIFVWQKYVAEHKEKKLSEFDRNVLALCINDFCDEEEKSEDYSFEKDPTISGSLSEDEEETNKE